MKACLEARNDHVIGKDAAATTVVCVFSFFLVTVLPLYFHNGYEKIATRKSLLFQRAGMIYGAVLILIMILKIPEWIRQKRKPNGNRLDLFVVLWGVVNFVSCLFSVNREEALWGTAGWYMGLVTQLICVLIYFGVSRFFPAGKRTGNLLLVIGGGCAALLFAWGLLNRFSVYPLEMEYSGPDFISSVGNINWMGGYYAVFSPLITGAYCFRDEIFGKRRWGKILMAVVALITLSFGIVEGSDDVYTSMALTFFLCLLFCREEKERMLRWCELVILTCAGCQIMRVTEALHPGSLNYYSTFTRYLLSNATLILFIPAVTGYSYLRFRKKEEQAKKVFRIFAQVLIILSVALLITYTVLLICNSLWPGSAGKLAKEEALIFNDQWGSSRGTTWMDGLKVWNSFDLKRKLLGAGPDCFAAYAYSHGELAALFKAQFGSARLTNAHNEVITILVDQGLAGVAVFLCMVAAGAKEGIRGLVSGKEMERILIWSALLSAFVYNQFSFEQVMITPYFYLMLGLTRIYARRDKAELEEIPQSL